MNPGGGKVVEVGDHMCEAVALETVGEMAEKAKLRCTEHEDKDGA